MPARNAPTPRYDDTLVLDGQHARLDQVKQDVGGLAPVPFLQNKSWIFLRAHTKAIQRACAHLAYRYACNPVLFPYLVVGSAIDGWLFLARLSDT